MEWLQQHAEVKTIRVAAADLNGVARGKRMPARYAAKLMEEGTKPHAALQHASKCINLGTEVKGFLCAAT